MRWAVPSSCSFASYLLLCSHFCCPLFSPFLRWWYGFGIFIGYWRQWSGRAGPTPSAINCWRPFYRRATKASQGSSLNYPTLWIPHSRIASIATVDVHLVPLQVAQECRSVDECCWLYWFFATEFVAYAHISLDRNDVLSNYFAVMTYDFIVDL